MTKQECARILGCAVEDVDSIMARYGISPMGAKHGRGGFYLPLLAPAIRDFEAKRDRLEAELLKLIADAIKNPLSLHFTLAGIRRDMEKSEGPQTLPDALQAFAVALDGE